MTQTLLIELRTEELPPKALNLLGNSLAASVAEALEKEQLIDGEADFSAYASPRRLAVQVKNVKAVQADRRVVKKGPAVAAGMKAALPHVDLFAPAHNLESLQALEPYLARI